MLCNFDNPSICRLVEAIDNLAANIIMTENETRIVKNNLAITLVKEGSVVDSGLLFGTRANTGRHNLAEKDVGAPFLHYG